MDGGSARAAADHMTTFERELPNLPGMAIRAVDEISAGLRSVGSLCPRRPVQFRTLQGSARR
jgi:hypothetical protein